jgi:hypothetical protein
MYGRLFKILTFILLITASFSIAFAQTLSQEEFKTHLRWTLKSPKEQISIKKRNNRLILETLNEDLYQAIVGDIARIDKKLSYMDQIQYSKEDYPNKPAKIIIDLKDDSVELFSFFKTEGQKYVMDFWVNKDLVETKKAAVVKKIQPVKKIVPKKKRIVRKKPNKIEKTVKKDSFRIIDPENVVQSKTNRKYKDFRYGAAFLWDYAAYIPPLEKDLNLKVKAPDYLYTVKDREFEKDPKEAHMQLSIKFFRQKKWGLMTKSINLYEKKYGQDQNREINDFMKATSLIKNTIKQEIKPQRKDKEVDPDEAVTVVSDSGTIYAGINILTNVAERTSDYEMKSATLRYIMQYALDREDYVKSLQLAKKLYVASTESFHDEMIIYSSRVILYSLTKLRQLDKISEFLSNKAVMRVLPKQEGKAYIGYVNLVNGKVQDIIRDYEAHQRSYAKPVHPAILYNTAEAYFREAEYAKAIKLYDSFAYHYPQLKVAAHSRLRIALAYDLLDKPVKQVLNLYENAINRSVDPAISYEAKVRYVGLSVARKKQLTKKDIETISFLQKSPAERKAMDNNLKKILWVVRLRTMISQGKFDDALAYLSTVPLESLNLVDKRTFEGDGAEVIVGLIKKLYLEENYSRAVKVWEVYKGKYESKVAKSPYLNFMVCDSFLKLGLFDSFERSFDMLKMTKNKKIRTFPKWVSEHKNLNIDNFIKELELIKLMGQKKWALADSFLDKLGQKQRKAINYNYYKGVVAYNAKKYNDAIGNFETILVSPNEENILSPRQTATMLTSYIESLYQADDHKRFRKNAMALINDIRKGEGKLYNNVAQRVEYLLIESHSSDVKPSYAMIEKESVTFIEKYKKSSYLPRVKYLYGISLLRNKKEKDGKKVLDALVESAETPEYLKGLARSELSSLMIKNKTL